MVNTLAFERSDFAIVFVPLARMPLNPNGKVDKPALPFPDTATAPPASKPKNLSNLTPTERKVHDIWARLLPSAPSEIPLDESFFDLGGHSILATRLIFEIRNGLGIPAPLGAVFDFPTLRQLAAELARINSDDFGLVNSATTSANTSEVPKPSTSAYADDLEKLIQKLPKSYAAVPTSDSAKTVFLTGATGFLGAFILKDLLERTPSIKKVICLVRAKSDAEALARTEDASSGRGCWDKAWVSEGRLQVLAGDLDSDKFGLQASVWDQVCEEVDMIVHNGALVSVLLVEYA